MRSDQGGRCSIRALAIFLFALLAAQLPEQSVAAQTSQTEAQRLAEHAQVGNAPAQSDPSDMYAKGLGEDHSCTEAAVGAAT